MWQIGERLCTFRDSGRGRRWGRGQPEQEDEEEKGEEKRRRGGWKGGGVRDVRDACDARAMAGVSRDTMTDGPGQREALDYGEHDTCGGAY